jgi:hypothetical protein
VASAESSRNGALSYTDHSLHNKVSHEFGENWLNTGACSVFFTWKIFARKMPIDVARL